MMHTPESYRREWATLTGRPEREVYIPKTLRPEGDEPQPANPVEEASE